MQVSVRDNNVDQALRALKKKLQREGVFREMKLKQHYEKPSEKKAREKAEGHPPCPQAGAQEIAARRASLKRLIGA
jgi:small subunit ribosomal protein S21